MQFRSQSKTCQPNKCTFLIFVFLLECSLLFLFKIELTSISGIYSDIGTKTCAGYPGHLDEGSTNESGKPKDYFALDAQTFAEWDVDSLKVDGCYANTTDFDWMYPSLGKALNKTQRPILYSCSWPAYVVGEGRRPDYESIAKHCNLWRNYGDIMDSWPSVLDIIDFYAKNQDDFEKNHGPGQWFDPDMIIVGDFGLSVDEARSQFALWSVMSAPLLLSNDLRTIAPEFKEILLNRHVISVDQDPLGHLGKRLLISSNKAIEVWGKRLMGGSFAVVYFNRGVLGNPKWVRIKISFLHSFKMSWLRAIKKNLCSICNQEMQLLWSFLFLPVIFFCVLLFLFKRLSSGLSKSLFRKWSHKMRQLVEKKSLLCLQASTKNIFAGKWVNQGTKRDTRYANRKLNCRSRCATWLTFHLPFKTVSVE